MTRRSTTVLAAAVALVLAGCTGGSGGSGTTGGSAGPSVTVWAVGDGPNGKPAARAVGTLVRSGHPRYLLYLGDVYGDYAERFDDAYGAAVAAKTLPTPGNHEWPSHRAEYLDYWKGVKGGTQPAYYSQTVGGWQLISLNSEEDADPGSPQYQWLEETLASAKGTCRIAFWHAPRFSAGQHGDEKDMAPAWDLLAGKAVAVLSGHDHTMQRLKPVDGITQLVSGAGGRSHYRLDAADDRLAFGDNTHDGALKLTLTGKSMRYRFVAVGGDVLDSGRLGCRPAG